MANLIQVKRSTSNNSPASLTAGELAYSFLNTSNSLFVGNTGTVGGPIRIAGGNYIFLHQSNTSAPGTSTANAVVIVNGNSFINAWKTNALTVGVDGATVSISNIATFANTTQLGNAVSGSNTELVSSWAIKTYIDNNAARLPNTQIAFGANSVANGGSASFTFDSINTLLTVGNTTVNTRISQTAIITSATVASGNTTITGFVNVSSYGTFGGTVNAASLNVSGLVAAGNTTVTGFINVSTFGTFGGTVNAASLNVSGVVASGNTTVTGFVNVSSYGTFGGTVNAASLNVSGLAATGNTTVTGFVNVSSYGTFGGTVNATALNISGVTTAGNTTVTGFINVSANSTFGGVVNAAALNISGIVTSGNTTVTGFVNTSSFGTFGGVVNATSFNSTGAATSTFANNVTVTGVVNATSMNTGDLSVSGNLNITGTLTTVNANNITITDSLIELSSNNVITPDVMDVGLFGNYGVDANTNNSRHTGLFRDASDGIWKLFTNLLPAPTTTIDTTNSTYTIGTLQTHLSSGGAGGAGLIANATTISVTANSTLNVSITANTLTLSTALSGTSGGTGLASYTSQDLLVANSTNGFSKLGVGAEGYILQVTSSAVTWGTLDGGSF
jgi:hypothetical protein